MRKNKKNTKIQSVFLAAIEKYKKNTKVQGVFFSYFFVFILYFFCIFTKKIRKKYEKNTKKIRIQNLKNTKYKKNTNPKSRKYKIQKKYKPNISKMQNSEKYKLNVGKKRQIPCSLSEEKPKLQKKCKNNMLYFLHPAVLILYFQVVFFLGIFCISDHFQHSRL